MKDLAIRISRLRSALGSVSRVMTWHRDRLDAREQAALDTLESYIDVNGASSQHVYSATHLFNFANPDKPMMRHEAEYADFSVSLLSLAEKHPENPLRIVYRRVIS